jgi:hypothetical protein
VVGAELEGANGVESASAISAARRRPGLVGGAGRARVLRRWSASRVSAGQERAARDGKRTRLVWVPAASLSRNRFFLLFLILLMLNSNWILAEKITKRTTLFQKILSRKLPL